MSLTCGAAGCEPRDRRHGHGRLASRAGSTQTMGPVEEREHARFVALHGSAVVDVAIERRPLPVIETADPYWGVVPYPLPIPVGLAAGEREVEREERLARDAHSVRRHTLSRRR